MWPEPYPDRLPDHAADYRSLMMMRMIEKLKIVLRMRHICTVFGTIFENCRQDHARNLVSGHLHTLIGSVEMTLMSDPDMGVQELAETVAETAPHSSVKRFYLDNSRGILNSTPPVRLLREDESVQFTFHNAKEGIEGTFEGVEEYDPSGSRGTLLMVTDERILILLGKEQQDIALSIPYGTIEETAFDASLLGANWLGFAGVSRIHLETEEGRYTIPIVKATRGDVKRVSRHIETYSEEAEEGTINEFEPEIDYQQPRETPRGEYKKILACRKCLSEVSRGVERCPHCGFAPQENTRGAAWKVGALGLSMSLLAPLGLAMGYDSVKKTRDAARGVWIEKTVEVSDSEEV